jgi:hypothetical protein
MLADYQRVQIVRHEWVLRVPVHVADAAAAIEAAKNEQLERGVKTDIMITGDSDRLVVYWQEETT